MENPCREIHMNKTVSEHPPCHCTNHAKGITDDAFSIWHPERSPQPWLTCLVRSID